LLHSPVRAINSLSILFLAGLPVLDVFVAIYRRYHDVPAGSTLKTRLKRIVGADNNHMHHRLLYLGMGHFRASLVLYTISAVLLSGAVLLAVLSPAMQFWVTLYLFASVTLALVPIYYRDSVEKLRQNLMAGLRGGSEQSWRVAVVCESAEVRDSIAAQSGLPFEFIYCTRDELMKPQAQSIQGALIEQLPGETVQDMLTYSLSFHSAWNMPLALVVSGENADASEIVSDPRFSALASSASVYNRPLYIWPLLLKMLERLHSRRTTGAFEAIGKVAAP